MKTKWTIRVTAKDIEIGIPKDEGTCPIALAASRVFKRKMYVSRQHIWPDDFETERWQIDIPGYVGKEIFDYDHGKQMKPFSFQVKL